MSKEFEDIVLKKLDALGNQVNNTDKMIQENILKKLETLDDITKKMGSLEIELKDTQEVVKYLNQSFTKFDYEINRKIDTLFDAITLNNEKHEVYEENIVSLNTKIFNHDIRISNLEDKVLTA